MKWITAQHLNDWPHKLTARTDFPAMVADLIQASSSSVTDIRFPNGDKGEVRGFDGVLRASSSSQFVPGGDSIWEFGTTTGDIVAKANADFNKRTEQVAESIRLKTTFVFATPRTWDRRGMQISDWLEEKRGLNQWHEVMCLDGIQLEHWLDLRPAVAAKYARQHLGGVPQTGASSTGEFWDWYSTRFSISLTEQVLIAGRTAQATQIVAQLHSGEPKISLAADSPDEVIAFVIAAVRCADDEIRSFLESRMLVVETADAVRHLLTKDGLIYLPRGHARHHTGQMVHRGPTVVSAGGGELRNQHQLLPRPTNAELAKAFTSMGIEESAGYDLARRCGRSLVVLAREFPSGTAESPEWMDSSPSLVPALLAGAWKPTGAADCEVLRQLGGASSYEDVERPLRRLTRLNDSPVERVDDVWTMRSAVDAFVHLGHLIGSEHLARFSQQLRVVFSRIVEPPKADDVFRPDFNDDEPHSTWLREGMMSTLLLMSALHEKADFVVAGSSPQHYVDTTVRGIPNLFADHRLLSSLGRQLPLLAEAAPIPFLEALEQLLEGDAIKARPIFDERDEFFAPESPHTCYLWALEVLAWDERHLLRAALCLARLAEVDPGGRLSNRPINSLREILVSWSPHTNAPSELRISVLRHVVNAVPSIAWALLVKLLPRSHDSANPTHQPRYAEASRGGTETLTYGIVWAAQASVVEMAVGEAALDPTRWKRLVGALGNMQPTTFDYVVDALKSCLDRQTPSDRLLTWDVLRKEAQRHRAFSDAKWALHSEKLDRLDTLVSEFDPHDPGLTATWLFDDWTPDVRTEDADPSKAIHAARVQAIRDILAQQGVPGVVSLATRVKLPFQMAQALSDLGLTQPQMMELFEALLSLDGEAKQLASQLVSIGFSAYGQSWIRRVCQLATHRQLSQAETAWLFLSLNETRATWELVHSVGEEVDLQYWKQKHAYALTGSVADMEYAVERYRSVGRSLAAIEATHRRLVETPTPLLLALLSEAIEEINALPQASNMVEYYVQHVFDELEGRPDIRQEDLARMEYAYLPFFHRRKRPLALHRMLIEQPAFFVSTISTIFKPAHGEAPEPTEKEKKYATAAYKLLNGLEVLPGQVGDDVDVEALASWTATVRKLAVQADRADVVDSRIGHLLAHAPLDPNDKVWPHIAVRKLIETLSSDIVERSVLVERFNMRGAHWAGNGGQEERVFAEQAKVWSKAAAAYPRTAKLLLDLAEMWIEHAQSADARAAKDALRW